MKIRAFKFVPPALVAALGLASASGCNTMKTVHVPKLHWPWAAKPVPAPPNANQVAWEGIDGAAAVEFPQWWARNTLIIDMTGASGAGSVRMHAKASMGWPKRIALRLRPGSVARIEVQADQRVVTPIVGSGAQSIEIALAPSVYSARTETIALSWFATP